ncbi:ATPase [Kaistia dalseonensis]|uniref:Chaperone required for assembly of F1-ATPase n=1 Tax=Kaistia dalseonensis TaxID=410840 RepID=A0ABU0H120_9HYPH|nr:ATP12 family protein [Kaistia dalseonensis]MCX5493450.1 ATPase [Kaistia dalseonensis]MDQ0436009.1 chaperone required for assembly of F1-ATPase [Kaistia dalseonensis]
MNGIFDPPERQERNERRDIARENDKRPLPKRFYSAVDYAADGDQFLIRLDGKPVRTPAKNRLAVTSEAVAATLVAEWAAQKDVIEPSTMPVTRLVNSAIDGVVSNFAAVKAEIVRYAGSDLLCYRADKPERLVRWQDELWSPPIAWMRERFDARFLLAEGVIHVEQFPETLEAVDAAIGEPDALRLAALNTITVLTGSAILALAVAYGRLSAEEAWTAAHVDEDFEIELWGEDAEATARRDARWREMQAAALVLAAG